MATMISIRRDLGKQQLSEYLLKLGDMSTEELLGEFISYLDYTEESDSGRVFHPVTIGSCRALMTEPLGAVLKEMRKRAKVNV